MRFIRTNRNISAVPDAGYTAEQLLGMMVDLARDVYDQAGVKKASELPAEQKKTLLLTMHSLSKILVDVYTNNRDGLDAFVDTDFREEVSDRAAQIQAQEALLAKISAEISEEEEKQTQLEAVAAQTQAARGHLLTVKQACDALAREIDTLNDTQLDQMAERKAEMEAELADRVRRADSLAADQSKLQTDLNVLAERLAGINGALDTLRNRVEALTDEEAAATAEKAQLEERIETVRVQLEEAKQRIGDLPAISESVQAEHQQLQMQITVLLNALNSAKSDTFLTENLYALPGSNGSLTVENYPDLAIVGKKLYNWEELESWFAELEQRINSLMEVRRAMLAILVAKAESLTAQADQE